MSKRETIINWIAELRSGRRKQGEGALKSTNNTYCCLGVLACVVRDEWKTPKFSMYEWIGDTKATAGFSDQVLKTMGLTREQQTKLWLMNDTEKKSFKEIADYIEQEILPFIEN